MFISVILSKLLEIADTAEISCFSVRVYGKMKKHRIAKQLFLLKP